MRICALFGHHDCPETIKPSLQTAVFSMIDQGAETFYIGHQGAFDHIAQAVLKEAMEQYRHIHCFIILAYMPGKNDKQASLPTLYPGGIESIPLKYAILHRNQWMMKKADCFIIHQRHTFGNTAKRAEQARRMGKITIIIP